MSGRSSSRRTAGQAFHGKASFEPGFGCTIADAVVGSCSAYPFFKKKMVTTGPRRQNRSARRRLRREQPDALRHRSMRRSRSATPAKDVRVVSIGVGEYPPPKLPATSARKWFSKWPTVKFAQKTMEINTQSMDELRRVLFGEVRYGPHQHASTRSRRWRRTCSKPTWRSSASCGARPGCGAG